MTAISPGAICTCRQTGAILYAVERKADDGQRWQLRSMLVTHQGSTLPTQRVVGEGDIVLIHPAEAYEPGTTLVYEGVTYEVAHDLGDSVELVVPESSYRDTLHYEAGNHIVLDKATLVLTHLLEGVR